MTILIYNSYGSIEEANISSSSSKTQSPSPKSVAQELFRTNSREQHRSATPVRYHDEQRKQEDGNILHVNIQSGTQMFTFHVPVSQMLQREREMRVATKKANVATSQWSASLLYALWKAERNQQDDVDIATGIASSRIVVSLSPEEAMRDYSSFQWKPWLTICMHEFYKTGSIHIPDDCLGSDLLIALEYLRIITPSPNIFVFDSSHPYERIRAWSAYFTKRRSILDWMIRDYRNGGFGMRTYTTTPNSQDGSNDVLLQVKGELVDVLGQSKVDAHLLYKTAHSVFSENDSDQALTREVPRKIRHDFRDQLLRFSPPKTKISFELHRVSVTKNGYTKKQVRPVLRIEGPIARKIGKTNEGLPSHVKAVPSSTIKNGPRNAVARPDPMQLPSTIRQQPIEKNDEELLLPDPNRLPPIGREQQKDPVEDELLPQKSAAKPISIVNMDQTSVTSALSYSMMEESTMGTIMNNSEGGQLMNTAPEEPKNEQPQPEAKMPQIPPTNKPVKRASRRTRKGTIKKDGDGDSRTLSASESTLTTPTYEKRKSRKPNKNTPCDSFESFLFTVCDRGVAFCDQMVPTGKLPPSERSGSHVREISFAHVNDQSTLLSFVSDDDRAAKGRAAKGRAANVGSSPNTEVAEALSKDLTELENAINAVKVVGDSLYKQVDDAVFRALDPENSQQPLESRNIAVVPSDSKNCKNGSSKKGSISASISRADERSTGGGSGDSLWEMSAVDGDFGHK